MRSGSEDAGGASNRRMALAADGVTSPATPWRRREMASARRSANCTTPSDSIGAAISISAALAEICLKSAMISPGTAGGRVCGGRGRFGESRVFCCRAPAQLAGEEKAERPTDDKKHPRQQDTRGNAKRRRGSGNQQIDMPGLHEVFNQRRAKRQTAKAKQRRKPHTNHQRKQRMAAYWHLASHVLRLGNQRHSPSSCQGAQMLTHHTSKGVFARNGVTPLQRYSGPPGSLAVFDKHEDNG